MFVADSRLVAAELRYPLAADSVAVTAVNMLALVAGFLGVEEAVRWLAARPVRRAPAADRAVADQAIRLATQLIQHDPPGLPGWPDQVAVAWQERAAALAAYHNRCPEGLDRDRILESLLHMHHNRALGIDADREALCRRLARQAALAWQAQDTGART